MESKNTTSYLDDFTASSDFGAKIILIILSTDNFDRNKIPLELALWHHRHLRILENLRRDTSTFSPNPSDAEKSSVDRMAANYMRLLQWLRRHLPKDVWAPLHKLRSKHLGPDYLWLRPPTFWPCCPYKGANNIQPELRSRVTTWVLPFLNRKGHSVRRASAN